MYPETTVTIDRQTLKNALSADDLAKEMPRIEQEIREQFKRAAAGDKFIFDSTSLTDGRSQEGACK